MVRSQVYDAGLKSPARADKDKSNTKEESDNEDLLLGYGRRTGRLSFDLH